MFRPVPMALAVIVCLLAACTSAALDSKSPSPSSTAPTVSVSGKVSVFAASSLTEAFKSIGASFKDANPGVEVEFNFAASSVLATQIEQGAPADVFASADQPQMQRLAKQGLTEGEDVVFARNVPVVIIPSDNPGNVQAVRDLGHPGLKLVLAGPDVPIGNYARQIIDRLASDPAYGEAFKTATLGNIVSNESNVRGVLTKVELGEADAGVVYRTDARVSANKVRVVAIPENANVIALYPIAVMRRTSNVPAAQAFIDFVRSAAGQQILRDAGFDGTE